MLSAKHKLFAAEYLKDRNATRAALSAGYSKRTAYSQGQRLLKHVEVSEYLQKKSDRHLEKLDISVDYVLTTIRQTISAALFEKEFGPAFKGLELLGKYHKLFTEKIEHSGLIEHVDLTQLNESQLQQVEGIIETATLAGR
jgi:phage terminase small subunit